MEKIKKIDIHAHVTIYPDLVPGSLRTGERFPSCEELLDFYDRLNIEKGVLLPLVSAEGKNYTLTNESCIVAARTYPDRLMWFCDVDPRAVTNRQDADLLYLMRHYQSLGARGVGELTAQLYADDPKIDHLFDACEACDFPVIIHISPKFDNWYGIVDELGLPRLEKMLQKHPKLKIIGHSQPFWAEMSADITEETRDDYPTGKVKKGRIWELMTKYENLYCDLSADSGMNAMMRDPDNAAGFMHTFADRILYGCDLCGQTYDNFFVFDAFLDSMVASGKLSEDDYRKIVRENAIRLLKLESEDI